MRLVFIIDNYRKVGGGSYAQLLFASTLAKKGHDVVIFAGDRSFFSDSLKLENIKVYYRPSLPIFFQGIGIRSFNNILRNIHFTLFLKTFIKNYKPNWVIGNLRHSAIKAYKIGRKYNIKVANFVYETPDWLEKQLGESLSKKLLNHWDQTKTAYLKSTVLIPNSQLSANQMRNWIPEAVISRPVYPGVEIEEFDHSKNQEKDIDIIFIGRLHKLKNVNDLLEACLPEYNCVIIGTGEELPTLKNIAETKGLRVNFLGSVTDRVKWDCLRRSKLMVHPSSFEGFGMPPLEALASGCKVICSDIPILHEIYGKEVTYFELHNIKDLQDKISKALSTPNNKKSELPALYTWSNSANTIESILNQFN